MQLVKAADNERTASLLILIVNSQNILVEEGFKLYRCHITQECEVVRHRYYTRLFRHNDYYSIASLCNAYCGSMSGAKAGVYILALGQW